MARVERNPRLFAPSEVQVERRADGSLLLRSPQPLLGYSRCIGEWLALWAQTTPDRAYLLERAPNAEWQGVTYSQALETVQRIGAWLLQQDLSAERPVAILSDNSVEHGLLALAAMHVGVPVLPLSPAYSLVSKDFGKLRAIIGQTHPGVIYVRDAARFAPALAAVPDLHGATILTGSGQSAPPGATPFSEVLSVQDDGGVGRAFAAVQPDTLAKVLFTSGSTGTPKGVINTQRMLCVNQQQIAQVWPFTAETPPVIVDWLPWSHTFGGNHNFNLVLRSGGTLYIDEGRPLPGLIEHTIANLREVAPTVYFNVPRGYDLLVAALRADPTLRDQFFSHLQLIFYAAAALPQHLWDALTELAQQTRDEPIPLVSAWGSTETAPLATSCHFQAEKAGVIGVPVPGCELKLIPQGEKLEVRVRGPNVTPGYWNQPELTARCFDEEGFYSIGDAVRFVDESRPELGLLFDGRISEDFKLSSGTWVNTGALRVKAIAVLAPVAQDIVIAGHDRDEIGLLIFPSTVACRQLCSDLTSDAPMHRVVAHPIVREHVRIGLRELRRQATGSSTFATRALLLTDSPSIDAGEITDKGYINQSAVLSRRHALVSSLYRGDDSGVIMLEH